MKRPGMHACGFAMLITLFMLMPVLLNAQEPIRVRVNNSVVGLPHTASSVNSVILRNGIQHKITPSHIPDISARDVVISRTRDPIKLIAKDNTSRTYRLPIFVNSFAPNRQRFDGQLKAIVTDLALDLPDKSRFTGTISFSLSDNTNTIHEISPIEVLVNVPSAPVSRSTTVSRSNSWNNVNLSVITPKANVLEAIVLMPSDDNGVSLPIEVSPKVLQLKVNPESEIRGLGLETATVTVSSCIPERLGTVNLKVGKGIISSETINMRNDNTSVKFTSVGLKDTKITATSQYLSEEVSRDINLVFPYGFLLAAIVGGGIGGLIGAFLQKKDAEEEKKREEKEKPAEEKPAEEKKKAEERKKTEEKKKKKEAEIAFKKDLRHRMGWGVVWGLVVSALVLTSYNTALLTGIVLPPGWKPELTEVGIGLVSLFVGIKGLDIIKYLMGLKEQISKKLSQHM